MELNVEIQSAAEAKADLKGLAHVAKQHLQFARCDVFPFDPKKQEFYEGRATYKGFENRLKPRPDGWSSYVARRRVSVFICALSEDSVRALEWSDGFWWEIDDSFAPIRLNEQTLKIGLVSEVAVPLMVEGNCVGVFWLKYSDGRTKPPAPAWIHRLQEYGTKAGEAVTRIVSGGAKDVLGREPCALASPRVSGRWRRRG